MSRPRIGDNLVDAPRDRLFAEVNGALGGAFAGLSLASSRSGVLWGARLGPANPQRPIRFTVGEPGRRATVWRVWANRNKDDVYIASRQSAGIFKISLHETGDWRCQWVNEDRGDVRFHRPDGSSADGRILVRWQRPASNANGWTDALSIWVPGDDIFDVPGDGAPAEDSQWIAPAPSGEAIEFRFWLVEPRRGPLELTSTLREGSPGPAVVNGFRLSTGEVLVIFAVVTPLDQLRLESLVEARRWARSQLDQSFDLSPAIGPRTAVFETEEDGHPSIWDLSLL